METTVIGCGVSGLTTALVLQDRGHDVTIVAEQLPFDTVSMVAGAIWTATTAEPRDRVPAWALRSREVFAELAADPTSGVHPLVHVDLHRTDPGPTWGEDTPWVSRSPSVEVPSGYEVALVVDGFVVDPPVYLRNLIDRFETAGGTVDLRRVERPDAVGGDAVVNCTGLGAAGLVADTTMFPIRGQVVAVANPGVERGRADESDQDRITYLYPRPSEVVLGGTRVVGATDPEPDPEIAERILADAIAHDPRLDGQPVVAHRVGLRPGRSGVRVEVDQLPDGRMLVHNYGHGGAGYIMSWGCAEEVASLLAGR